MSEYSVSGSFDDLQCKYIVFENYVFVRDVTKY